MAIKRSWQLSEPVPVEVVVAEDLEVVVSGQAEATVEVEVKTEVVNPVEALVTPATPETPATTEGADLVEALGHTPDTGHPGMQTCPPSSPATVTGPLASQLTFVWNPPAVPGRITSPQGQIIEVLTNSAKMIS